jgi:sec-independent protein translocase protein TatC
MAVTPSPDEEAELESSKAPLLEHLVELRNRIVYSLIAFVICFIGCYFVATPIYTFLTQPLADALADRPGATMIFTQVYEAFFTNVRVGAFGALCIAFPFMAWQLWMFIAPGLYRHERSAFVPFLIATPIMFLLGAAFVYYLVLPAAIQFFLGFEVPGGNGVLPIELQARVGEYLSFVMMLIFAFGFCFELPVLLVLLGRVGIVTSEGLAASRRYAIVGVVAVAAVVTPPDVFSQVALSVPLVGLYEVSIWCVRLIERARARREAAEAASSRNIQPT